MKKIFAAALAAMTLLGLVSCEKEKKVVPSADVLAGTYNCTYTLSVMGSAQEGTGTITITRVDDNTVTLTTPQAGEGMMTLPSITTSGIKTSRTTVDGAEFSTASVESLSGSVSVNGEEKNYNFTGLSIVGDGNTISVNYSLQYGRMPMAMDFRYTGRK